MPDDRTADRDDLWFDATWTDRPASADRRSRRTATASRVARRRAGLGRLAALALFAVVLLAAGVGLLGAGGTDPVTAASAQPARAAHAARPTTPPAAMQVANGAVERPAVARLRAEHPDLLSVYQQAGRRSGVHWPLLAAIARNETGHATSTLPGVHSGVNQAGCCSGMMQLCTVAACGNAWQTYAVDANANGTVSVYEPADAVAAAARMLVALRDQVGDDPARLLAAYNAGAGNVLRYGGVPPFAETRDYVTRGLRYARQLGL